MNSNCNQTEDVKAHMRMAASCIIYALSFAGTLLIFSAGIVQNKVLAAGLIAVVISIGLGMIYNYYNYLKVLDELQKKIQQDALALAVGAAVIWGCTTPLLQEAGIMNEPSHAWIVTLISVFYSFGVFRGERHYS